jgi:hypothetical protein
MSEIKKSTTRVSKIQICVAAVLIILALAMPFYSRYTEYRNGLSGEGPGSWVFLLILFCFPLIGLLAILSLVAGLIHIYRDPRSFRKSFVAVILVLIPTIFVYISLIFFTTPTVEYYLNGYSKWVVANIDLDELEKWLPNVPERYWGASYRFDFPKDLPRFVTIFEPKFISFSANISDTDDRFMSFSWGGGLSAWGFVITEPSEETSKPGEINKYHITESYVEIRRTVRPGIYVFVSG